MTEPSLHDVDQRMWNLVRFVNSVDHTTVKEVAEECKIPRDQAKVYLHRAAGHEWITRQIRGVYGPGQETIPEGTR